MWAIFRSYNHFYYTTITISYTQWPFITAEEKEKKSLNYKKYLNSWLFKEKIAEKFFTTLL